MVAWHLAVVIPARNEVDLLPGCLRSIAAARRTLPPQVTSDVVVAVDSSTDGTFELAERMLAGQGLAMRVNHRCVGEARSAAAAAALARAQGRRIWLANTDADCILPEDWLLRQLRFAEAGTDAVAGIVDVEDFSEHLPHVADAFRSSYLLHEDGTHPHIHGANLGVRAECYLAAGGWGGLETAEDHDLWGRLRLHGFQMQSSRSLRVVTSGRILGRAPLGFAQALAAHNEGAL